MRVVVTGGHHTTAFALIDELKKHVNLDILWLGHKYSMPGDKAESLEYLSVKKRSIRFVDLKAGKFYRTFHPLKLLRIPLGFIQAFYELVKFKPDLIVSFGGYLAVPTVVSGWCLQIPSVTHEQTTTAGFANRLLSKFVKIIFISWPSSLNFFPKKKVSVSGNPLRKEIFVSKRDVYAKLKDTLDDSRKTIYITGGKQGSHILNEVIKSLLPSLLCDFNVIHQCGRSTFHDDYKKIKMLKEKLPEDLKNQYILRDYINGDEIGSVFALCDLVISRSGANVVYELAALGKVAIFIPIPWLPYDEQTKNAQVLVTAGSAEILAQKNLTAEALLLKINRVTTNFNKYTKAAEKAKGLVRLNAAEKIVSELKKLFPSRILP